jgi:hypothetical protein
MIPLPMCHVLSPARPFPRARTRLRSGCIIYPNPDMTSSKSECMKTCETNAQCQAWGSAQAPASVTTVQKAALTRDIQYCQSLYCGKNFAFK